MSSDGRVVSVAAERLAGWLGRFVERHGAVTCTPAAERVVLTAVDGAVADVEVPFPPLVPSDDAYGGLVAHALTERCVGVLLVRRGGYAAGVFRGSHLEASKVGSRHVQGRSAAGGWSQQRFARRREDQTRQALTAAADTAVNVLVPAADRGELEAVVLGGDRRVLDDVMADSRLVALRPLVLPRRLNVPDPRLRVLQGTPALFRAVRIHVVEPEPRDASYGSRP